MYKKTEDLNPVLCQLDMNLILRDYSPHQCVFKIGLTNGLTYSYFKSQANSVAIASVLSCHMSSYVDAAVNG